MMYLEAFRNFSSKEDFEKIDHVEYVELLTGASYIEGTYYRFTESDQNYIDNKWKKFTMKETRDINKMMSVEKYNKEIFVNSTVLKYSPTYYKITLIPNYTVIDQGHQNPKFITQSVTITKFLDDWFIVSYGSSDPLPVIGERSSYKCDGWVGLVKCLKYLRKMGVQVFKQKSV